MNLAIFTGRVGRDSELRTTPSGKTVLNFSVANDVGYGERKTTQWVTCAVWNERAEKLHPYVKKGLKVTVSGEVTVRAYTNKQGEAAAELQLTVRDLDMHGGRSDEQQQGSAATTGEQRDAFGGGSRSPRDMPERMAPGELPRGGIPFDDDIPF